MSALSTQTILQLLSENQKALNALFSQQSSLEQLLPEDAPLLDIARICKVLAIKICLNRSREAAKRGEGLGFSLAEAKEHIELLLDPTIHVVAACQDFYNKNPSQRSKIYMVRFCRDLMKWDLLKAKLFIEKHNLYSPLPNNPSTY